MKAGEDRRAEHVVVDKEAHFIFIDLTVSFFVQYPGTLATFSAAS